MTTDAETAIRQELEKTANLITGARRLMAEGRQVDLGAMEERITAVGKAFEIAPPETASAFKEHLNALMEALDALEQDLQAHHEALEKGLNAIRHREAENAYGPGKKES